MTVTYDANMLPDLGSKEFDEDCTIIGENKESRTGVYDVRFLSSSPPLPPSSVASHTALEHLVDAKIGLSLFLNEASAALMLGEELTIEQRVHIATIVSYIESLSERFDKVVALGLPDAEEHGA